MTHFYLSRDAENVIKRIAEAEDTRVTAGVVRGDVLRDVRDEINAENYWLVRRREGLTQVYRAVRVNILRMTAILSEWTIEEILDHADLTKRYALVENTREKEPSRGGRCRTHMEENTVILMSGDALQKIKSMKTAGDTWLRRALNMRSREGGALHTLPDGRWGLFFGGDDDEPLFISLRELTPQILVAVEVVSSEEIIETFPEQAPSPE